LRLANNCQTARPREHLQDRHIKSYDQPCRPAYAVPNASLDRLKRAGVEIDQQPDQKNRKARAAAQTGEDEDGQRPSTDDNGLIDSSFQVCLGYELIYGLSQIGQE
jgi:hypothetical protein